MDNRAIALKLILDDLGTNSISSVEQRMEVQKAVYLVQAAGIALGYTYGWYLKGPYSPSLTRDYYDFNDETVPQGTSLKPAAVSKLNLLKTLIDEPIGALRRPQRLELLASLHYLMKSSGFSRKQASEKIAETKPHLASETSKGFTLLRQHNLL